MGERDEYLQLGTERRMRDLEEAYELANSRADALNTEIADLRAKLESLEAMRGAMSDRITQAETRARRLVEEVVNHDSQCERQWKGAPSWAQDLRGWWCRCSWRRR